MGHGLGGGFGAAAAAAKVCRQAVVGVRVQVTPELMRGHSPSGCARNFDDALGRDAIPLGDRLRADLQRLCEYGA